MARLSKLNAVESVQPWTTSSQEPSSNVAWLSKLNEFGSVQPELYVHDALLTTTFDATTEL